MENSTLKQASLSYRHGVPNISGHRSYLHPGVTNRFVFRAHWCLPDYVFKLCSLPDYEVYIPSLQSVQVWDRPSSKPVFSKFIPKSFIWDWKTFSHRNKLLEGGTQKPGWATAYLKCGIDCTSPNSHYLSCFSGKVLTWDACSSPLPLPGSLRCSFFRLCCSSCWREGTGWPSQEKHECRVDTAASGECVHAGRLKKNTSPVDQSLLLLLNEAQRAGTFLSTSHFYVSSS